MEVLDFPEYNHSLLGDHRPIKVIVDRVVRFLAGKRYKTKDVPLPNFSRDVINSIVSQDLTFKNVTDIITLDIRYDILMKLITQSTEINFKKRNSTFTPGIAWSNAILRTKRNNIRALYEKKKK